MSRKKDKSIDKLPVGWKRALDEAERQIIQYKRKIHELNRSATIMREKIAAREPWPGDEQLKRHTLTPATQC
jgi:hypothetical protein